MQLACGKPVSSVGQRMILCAAVSFHLGLALRGRLHLTHLILRFSKHLLQNRSEAPIDILHIHPNQDSLERSKLLDTAAYTSSR